MLSIFIFGKLLKITGDWYDRHIDENSYCWYCGISGERVLRSRMQDTVCLSDGLVTSGPLPLGLHGELWAAEWKCVYLKCGNKEKTDGAGNSFVQTCRNHRRFEWNQNFVGGGDNKAMTTFWINQNLMVGGSGTVEVVLEVSTDIVLSGGCVGAGLL